MGETRKHYELLVTDHNGHNTIVSAYGRNLGEAIQDGVRWRGSLVAVSENGQEATAIPHPNPMQSVKVSVYSVRETDSGSEEE